MLLASALVWASLIPGGYVAKAEDVAPKGEPATKPSSEEAHPPGPPGTINGFREAHFGMGKAQVRQAIRKDFPNAAANLKIANNHSEKTTVLSLTVSDLLPGTGSAQISYILGHKSRKLIQVNILWMSGGTEEKDQEIVGTANALRDYFTNENYKRDSVLVNRQVAEQTIIVFRAMDEQGRTIVVVLSGAGTALRNEAKGPKPPPLTLELSYILDLAHPDVFKINKGEF
jgi:hypothetical protein